MKKTIIESLLQFKEQALNGEIKSLDAYLDLKEIGKVLSEVENSIKDDAISEADNFEKKEFTYLGHKIALRNTTGRWDYSNTIQVKEAQEKLKSIQKLAQNALAEKKHGNQIFDSEGVEIEPATYHQGKTNIFVTLKKE